ncbi:MAG: PDZ domain-containing protein [Chitinophagales bacterium]
MQLTLPTFALLFLLQTVLFAEPKIEYHLSFPEPHTHYVDVDMRIMDLEEDSVDVKMAVWTPGSYLVREYSRHIDAVQAIGLEGKPLKVKKINKNTWRVYNGIAKNISIQYNVYAFELTVRTSFIDADFAALNGASIFLYPADMQQLPSTVHLYPHKNWQKVSTPLKPVKAEDPLILKAPNYDILVDSPIALGNQEVIDFQAAGVPHRVMIEGKGNYETAKMVDAMQKIGAEAVKLFGEHPCEDYLYMMYNWDGGRNGLEHLSSTMITYPRWDYEPESRFLSWAGITAHEYVHLWLVKRLRPIELGPFDYENENYTHLLWVMEGVTSYYDDMLLRRSDLMDVDDYLQVVTHNIDNTENVAGNEVQCVAHASFDAWIKYYNRNENSNNTTVSYYTKGAVLGTLLDLEIIHHTKGEKGLDDVLQYMYQRYFKELQRGFTDEEFEAAVEMVIGKEMDAFFEDYVFDTEAIDYNKYFNYAGLQLVNVDEFDESIDLGARLKSDEGKLTIVSVNRGTPAYLYGLNARDEIVAIDGFRTDSELALQKVISHRKAGDRVTFTVNRGGVLKDIEVELDSNHKVHNFLEQLPDATKEQQAVYMRWLDMKEF